MVDSRSTVLDLHQQRRYENVHQSEGRTNQQNTLLRFLTDMRIRFLTDMHTPHARSLGRWCVYLPVNTIPVLDIARHAVPLRGRISSPPLMLQALVVGIGGRFWGLRDDLKPKLKKLPFIQTITRGGPEPYFYYCLLPTIARRC